jgi:hypothetical protein
MNGMESKPPAESLQGGDSPFDTLLSMARKIADGDIESVHKVIAAAGSAQLEVLQRERLLQALKQSSKFGLTVLRRVAAGLLGSESGEGEEESDSGRLFTSYDPLPPNKAMPLGAILDEVAGLTRRRVACGEEAITACALWTVGTWGVRPGGVSEEWGKAEPGPRIYPRLHIKSGSPESGKTTMMDTLRHVVTRAYPADTITRSALFRIIEQDQPTMILDEVDTWFRDEGMRSVLNSRHARAGVAVVSEKVRTRRRETFEPTRFRTFAPIALAGIGGLPKTVESRSIIITLQRTLERPATRLRARDLEAFRDQIGPHLATHAGAIARAMAEGVDTSRFPSSLGPRACDNWEPLFCLADIAGGEWPARALHACQALSAGERELSRNEQLLGDLWDFQQDRLQQARAEVEAEWQRSRWLGLAMKAPDDMISTTAFRAWL